MADVAPSKGTPAQKGSTTTTSSTRQLNEEEKGVDQLAKQTLVNNEEIETKAVIAPTEMRSPKAEEIERFEPPQISFQAVESVEFEKEKETYKPPLSIHDKWASKVKDVLLKEKEQAPMDRIVSARKKIASVKKMYSSILSASPETPLQNEVNFLLTTGKLERIKGGMGGVYLLSDADNNPRYVIKPGDEALLALNNGKKFASPYLDEDGKCSSAPGIGIYEAVENAELSYKAAELFNLQTITPKTEVMIIEHPLFHNLFDDTQEKESREGRMVEKIQPSTKQKVCLVQSYLDGYQDMGSYLVSAATLPAEELQRLFNEDFAAYQKLEEEHILRISIIHNMKPLRFLPLLQEKKMGMRGIYFVKKHPLQLNKNKVKKNRHQLI